MPSVISYSGTVCQKVIFKLCPEVEECTFKTNFSVVGVFVFKIFRKTYLSLLFIFN